MKTMRKDENTPAIRVKEEDVQKRLTEGYKFCNKQVYKKETREKE